MCRSKLTTEQAIEKAKTIHPDLDFSKVTDYDVDRKSLWTVGCPTHGDYNYPAYNLLYRKSRGCKACEDTIKKKNRANMYMSFSCKKRN